MWHEARGAERKAKCEEGLFPPEVVQWVPRPQGQCSIFEERVCSTKTHTVAPMSARVSPRSSLAAVAASAWPSGNASSLQDREARVTAVLATALRACSPAQNCTPPWVARMEAPGGALGLNSGEGWTCGGVARTPLTAQQHTHAHSPAAPSSLERFALDEERAHVHTALSALEEEARNANCERVSLDQERRALAQQRGALAAERAVFDCSSAQLAGQGAAAAWASEKAQALLFQAERVKAENDSTAALLASRAAEVQSLLEALREEQSRAVEAASVAQRERAALENAAMHADRRVEAARVAGEEAANMRQAVAASATALEAAWKAFESSQRQPHTSGAVPPPPPPPAASVAPSWSDITLGRAAAVAVAPSSSLVDGPATPVLSSLRASLAQLEADRESRLRALRSQAESLQRALSRASTPQPGGAPRTSRTSAQAHAASQAAHAQAAAAAAARQYSQYAASSAVPPFFSSRAPSPEGSDYYYD